MLVWAPWAWAWVHLRLIPITWDQVVPSRPTPSPQQLLRQAIPRDMACHMEAVPTPLLQRDLWECSPFHRIPMGRLLNLLVLVRDTWPRLPRLEGSARIPVRQRTQAMCHPVPRPLLLQQTTPMIPIGGRAVSTVPLTSSTKEQDGHAV